MEQRLQDFIKQETGQANVGDTPENKGQCVGLIEVWIDTLGLPHDWGNAKDLLTGADPAAFDVIQNTPTNVPVPGDIVVWGQTWGNGNGHTGVVVIADVNTMQVFQQNDPEGSTPHSKQYTYAGVLGWLHPKTAPAPESVAVPADTFKQLVDKSTKYDAFNAAGYVTIDDVLKKVGDLNAQITKLQQEVQQAKNDAQAAHQQAAALSGENSAAIQSGLDASHERDQLKIQIAYYAHELGLPDNATTQQVADAITALKKPAEETAAQVVPVMDGLYNAAKAKKATPPQADPITRFVMYLLRGWNK